MTETVYVNGAIILWFVGFFAIKFSRYSIDKGSGNHVMVPPWFYKFCGSPYSKKPYKYIIPMRLLWYQSWAGVMLIILFFSYLFQFNFNLSSGFVYSALIGAIIPRFFPKY